MPAVISHLKRSGSAKPLQVTLLGTDRSCLPMTASKPDNKDWIFTVHNISDDLLATSAARMYHEQQRTQHEIANNLNVSQVTVCRLLKKAEERHIIRTTVRSPVGTFIDLEELLERKFGLAQVIIARAPNESDESVLGLVGAAAAYFLSTTLKSKAVIGVAPCSATLLPLVEQMHPIWKLSECKAVQILGGVEKHASYLVKQLAYLVRGEAHLLLAPALVASKGAVSGLLQDS